MSRCRFVSAVLGVLLLACVGIAGAAAPGTLVITDHKLEPSSETFEKDLKDATKTALPKSGDSWHVYFVAYLKKPAGSPDINIVFYAPGNKEPVNAYPIQTKANAKVVMSDIEVKPEDGFKPGKYNVLITRLIGGKEEVYAKTTLELK